MSGEDVASTEAAVAGLILGLHLSRHQLLALSVTEKGCLTAASSCSDR